MKTDEVVQLLQGELDRRKERNPSYSLRAFARSIGIPASHLSEVLSQKHGLSLRAAQRITRALRMTPREEKRFLSLVESKYARSPKRREEARKYLRLLKTREISPEEIELISHWKYFALLELNAIYPEVSLEVAIEELSMEREEVLKSIELLISLDMVEWVSHGVTYRTKTPDTRTFSEVPSLAIRSAHTRILSRAIHAIDDQAISDRNFKSRILAFPSSRMEEAKDFIANFVEDFQAKFGSDQPDRDSVYVFASQLFALTQPPSVKKQKEADRLETAEPREISLEGQE